MGRDGGKHNIVDRHVMSESARMMQCNAMYHHPSPKKPSHADSRTETSP